MIAQLKAALPDKPVILLTGVQFDSKVVSGVLKAKVACYIAKTSSLAQILEAVRRLAPISSN
jgi:DNA-binding NarL/FixJ family response regulator